MRMWIAVSSFPLHISFWRILSVYCEGLMLRGLTLEMSGFLPFMSAFLPFTVANLRFQLSC